MPMASKKDLIDIPKKVKSEMEFIFVEEIGEVFKHALAKPSSAKTPKQKTIQKKK
jgi:ATP-dependent Lon protease